MQRILGIQVSHADASSLVRALRNCGSSEASSASLKIRTHFTSGSRSEQDIALSPEEEAAVFAYLPDALRPLVEMHSPSFMGPGLAQRLGCPECSPHTLWSHDGRGCTIEGCLCKLPQPPDVAARKEEHLRDQQAAIEALGRRPEPVSTEPREPVRYEGKFCAGCGINFTTGDVGWHYVTDESGKVIRFCAKCWEELYDAGRERC